MSISTVNQASASTYTKQSAPSAQIQEIQKIRDITKDSIESFFPLLNGVRDILYIAMAIWGLESGWHLWQPGHTNSMHLSPVDPNNSTLIGKGYYFADPIRSLVQTHAANQPLIENVKQGFVAHGLSACMGCYHVKGTPNNISEFKPYQSVVNTFGLEIDPSVWVSNPAQSITSLFPNNDNGKQNSIVSGLIVLEGKYKIGLKTFNNNPDRAIEAAVGWYVGKAGSRDINGYSPEDRVQQVFTPSSRLALLASAGIVRAGQSGKPSTVDLAALSSTTPGAPSTTNSPSGTVAQTDGTPSNSVGCST